MRFLLLHGCDKEVTLILYLKYRISIKVRDNILNLFYVRKPPNVEKTDGTWLKIVYQGKYY